MGSEGFIKMEFTQINLSLVACCQVFVGSDGSQAKRSTTRVELSGLRLVQYIFCNCIVHQLFPLYLDSN